MTEDVVNSKGETLIRAVSTDDGWTHIHILVDIHGRVVIKHAGTRIFIPQCIAEEVSSAVYCAWESTDAIMAAHNAAKEATELAEQARIAVLEKIARGERR